MRTRSVAVVSALLAAALAAHGAEPQEGPPRPLLRAMAGMAGRLQMRPAIDTVAELGECIPAVRQELERHRQAMMAVLTAHLGLVNELDKALRELREAGAEDAQLEGAAAMFAPHATELAAKRAATLATHYANLAKILNPDDEAKRKEVISQLAEGILKRMATEPEERGRPVFLGPPPGGGRFPGGLNPPDRGRGGPPAKGGEGGGDF